MHKFDSAAEREAAIAAGETTRRDSTLQDGQKHYALVSYSHDGDREVFRNLTGTDHDTLDSALAQERRYHFGPHAQGTAGIAAERIA